MKIIQYQIKGGLYMKFLTTPQFADAIGVCKNTVVNWERKGWLIPHHVLPNGRRYYSDEQVTQILQGGTEDERSQ